MTASVLINHTRETTRRVDCKFGVSYDADIAKVKDILMTVAAVLHRCITKSAAVLRHCGAQGQCGRSRLQGLVQDLQILGCKVLPGGTGQTRF